MVRPSFAGSGALRLMRPEPAAALTIERTEGWEAVERALEHDGLRRAWERLLHEDRVATFYQTPLWCATWYRCYRDEFKPWLLVARAGSRLVGLAPLAVERRSGRLLFAGDDMADYRDFPCEEDWRRAVVPKFLDDMLRASGGAPFAIGQTQPESETMAVAARWAAERGIGALLRTHPCRRFRFEDGDLAALFRKKSLKQAAAHYRKAGGLDYRRIRDRREWERVKDVFFRQHSLRQALAGREPSFEDERKRALYESLFDSLDPDVHFSVLCHDDRALSFMFCFHYRSVLHYGAPTFDPLEARHSPGLLHLLEAMECCRRQGYREVDLTIGSAAFKERLANHRVDLPTLDLYPRRTAYWVAGARRSVVTILKGAVRSWTGSEEPWGLIKEALALLRARLALIARRPPRRILAALLRQVVILLTGSYRAEIFRLRPEDLTLVEPAVERDRSCELHLNGLEDFLTLEGEERTGLSARLQEALRRIQRGHVLHGLLVDGRLVQFGWSHRPDGRVYLPETRTAFPVPPGAVSLYDFNTAPDWRGRRLYPANLSRIAVSAFEQGAGEVYIVCEAGNRASRRGIELVGFRRCAEHRMRRVLGFIWRSVHDERSGVGPREARR